ncbi:MAG: NADPH-dependent glutamate synthase [Oscillospiraceae bacterium]
MINKSLVKTQETVRDRKIRNKDFLETSFGYTEEEALLEAQRCLNCKHKPCVSDCPINVPIPEFIKKITEGKFLEAYDITKTRSSMPAICSRVCPQETQCEMNCVRGIKGEPVAIGKLEQFVADYARKENYINEKKEKPLNKKVAVIGSGPASLACARDLNILGYNVTVFEKLDVLGGVLSYGIPQYRLPKKLVEREIDLLKETGIEFKTNVNIDSAKYIDDLKQQGFMAFFLGTGVGVPKKQGIKGENANGVYSAKDFLTNVNFTYCEREKNNVYKLNVGKKVVVIGGGNVAMDSARTAKRIKGVESVYVLYRRDREDMPARLEEIEHAMEEDVIFKFYTKMDEILVDDQNNVKSMKCKETENIKAENGKTKLINKENISFEMDADTVIISIGHTPDNKTTDALEGLSLNDWGGIVVDKDTCSTNIEGVFAGGDIVTGTKTVTIAMSTGKTAAKSINDFLSKK